ncbi:MAG: hypothetical protein CL532_06625 [Aestuariivita sp.]|nr:hypothetical protein [Aestuariivita sp.]|tara:strand:+ start:1369 stop:1554 length:186 start_codon:yes stop_codon:yes gene_type:complete
MRVLKVLDTMEVCIVDLEVDLEDGNVNAHALCAISRDKVIPLSTPDGKLIVMNANNAISVE